jgi:hypothetical protein
LTHAFGDGHAGGDHAEDVAALESGRVQGQALFGWKLVSVQGPAFVRRQRDAPAARAQDLGQGLGGKQVSASASCGQNGEP